jgi:hypothetical protein
MVDIKQAIAGLDIPNYDDTSKQLPGTMPDFGIKKNYSMAIELAKNVGVTAIEVLPDNPFRSYALLVNDSDTDIYISLGGTAVVNKGIRINASGGAYEINSTNLYKGRFSAISSAADKTLLVVEW